MLLQPRVRPITFSNFDPHAEKCGALKNIAFGTAPKANDTFPEAFFGQELNMWRRTFRMVNALFWLAVWGLAVFFGGVWGNWVAVILFGFVPAMFCRLLHIALRNEETT